jgi:hypothetical protein
LHRLGARAEQAVNDGGDRHAHHEGEHAQVRAVKPIVARGCNRVGWQFGYFGVGIRGRLVRRTLGELARQISQ